MESLTLVNTAAPSAIPNSTVNARIGCFRILRRLNQMKNLKKKSTFCMLDALVKFNSAGFSLYYGVWCFARIADNAVTKH